MNKTEAKKKAKQIIACAEVDPTGLKTVIKELKADFQFGLARKALARLSKKEPENLWNKQQLALCTYKDEELPPAMRFAEALTILEGIGLREPGNNDAETLALGGAVYKRMWEFGGQLEHLYEALSFYRAAYERNPEQDCGYGGVNAAYILQILAARTLAAAKRSGTKPVEAEKFEKQASDVREAIVNQLTGLVENDPTLKKENWFVVTLAEACFGLGKYKEAGEWLAISRKLDLSEWKQQTTFKQLVAIARMHGAELPAENSEPERWHEAWQALTNLLDDGTEAALSCYRGKVGLALSGGGFRASFYHLGVLSRLAEMDVLRSVEVLSTVSGGSIVGAHYYLEVKKLLENKTDNEITREDYIDIVRRVQKGFIDGVQHNIRTLALADFKKNLKMIWSGNYGRSHRLGELYEELLYAKVQDNHPQGQPRHMHELLIKPKGEEGAFHPGFSNWRRRAKVPVLLLNATSLKTGHNWRFTAKSMGESPGMLGSEVDKNSRYRRLWYEQAPTEALKNYRFGYAVAASACVPGLFDPLTLEGLYEGKVVRLVDGGVHDNQGVTGLLDEACNFILCSDASGQMDDKDKPSDGIPAVLLRSNSIVMDRVREAEYENLRARLDSRALQGLFFIHLKKDLQAHPKDWIDCQDPTSKLDSAEACTPYGIAPEVQRLLAGIRTDLDSFTDVEANSLMGSGYLMTEQQFKALQNLHEKNGETGKWGGFQVKVPREEWDFLKLESLMAAEKNVDSARGDLEEQLQAGSSLAFKIWKLDPRLKKASWMIAAFTAIILIAIIKASWGVPIFFKVGGVILALVLAAATLAFPILNWLFPEKAARRIINKIGLALFGYLAAKIHLTKFDKMFLEWGKLSRLLKKRRE